MLLVNSPFGDCFSLQASWNTERMDHFYFVTDNSYALLRCPGSLQGSVTQAARRPAHYTHASSGCSFVPSEWSVNTVIATVACAISQGISLILKIRTQPQLKLLMAFCIKKKKFSSWKSKIVNRARNHDTIGVTQPFECLKVSDYWGKASLLSHSTHWVSTLGSCSR